jgi:hypothetical protein
MMLRSSLLIGSLVSLSTLAVVGAETPRTYTPPEVAYIQGLNCDSFADAAAKSRCLDVKNQVATGPQAGSGAPLPPPPPRSGSGIEQDRPPHQDEDQSGSQTRPPRPPMGSGAQEKPDGQGLGMAMAQLSPADRATLDQMIRDYLTSKGIDTTKFAEKREAVKAVKQETRTAIQAVREEKKQVIQTKRIEMRGKIRDIRQGSGSGSVR